MRNTYLQGNLVKGHRKRLRQRFLTAGLDGFHDYEIVELLLTLGTPRKDCKGPAKDAIIRFKGLIGVMNASTEELQQVTGIGPSNVFGILLFQELAKRYSKEKLDPKLLLSDSRSVFDYLRERIGKKSKECFTLLCLDSHNKLIIEDISIGILNASLVHPREVFRIAILNNSSHVVVAHNHPSGDPAPSKEDLVTTNRLVEAGKILGITVIDHIIVTQHTFVSLKEIGVINDTNIH